MTGLAGVHHVQLTAPPGSEAVLRRFYVEVLGMTEVPKPPELVRRGGAWFRAAGVELHLGIEAEFRPALKGHPGLLVEDLPAYAERLAGHGVRVEWDDQFPGFLRCYVSDPHGNRIELLEPEERRPEER